MTATDKKNRPYAIQTQHTICQQNHSCFHIMKYTSCLMRYICIYCVLLVNAFCANKL